MADSEESLDDLYIQEEGDFDWGAYLRSLTRPVQTEGEADDGS